MLSSSSSSRARDAQLFAAGALSAALVAAGLRWRSARLAAAAAAAEAAAAEAAPISTTSSSHSGNVYESDKAVAEYLMFHYGAPADLLPYPAAAAAPVAASLDFATRTAELCALWARRAGAGEGAGGELGAAFDVGCAVGRSSFELSRLGFSRVVGLDFSHAFVAACEALARSSQAPYSMQVEGDVQQQCVARLPVGALPERCRFLQGDACALDVARLRELAGGGAGFSLVHAANLLCRLPEPLKFLRALPALVAPRGLVVFFSPYSWLKQYTAREHWLGGTAAGPRSAAGLRAAMEGLGFELLHEEDVPFLIREHARKFQHGFAHCTVYRKV